MNANERSVRPTIRVCGDCVPCHAIAALAAIAVLSGSDLLVSPASPDQALFAGLLIADRYPGGSATFDEGTDNLRLVLGERAA